MNVFQACLLICLGVIFGSVDAQIPTRQESSKNKDCGPGRFFEEVYQSCRPTLYVL